jgi:hypothetical protein
VKGTSPARSLPILFLIGSFGAVSPSAEACVCSVEPLAIHQVAGRVFTLDGRPAPEPIAEATVVLRTALDRVEVATAITDSNGVFQISAPPPGTYWMAVTVLGFRSTELQVRVKKGRGNSLDGLAIRVDMAGGACRCGDACILEPGTGGHLGEPSCLVKRSRRSGMLVWPPNKGLKRTSAACQAEPALAA